MEIAERQGWHVLANWGRDGWNLGEWPYVMIYIRNTLMAPPKYGIQFEMQQVVEGDHDIYRFDNEDDRDAAIHYLFLWYAADKSWAPLKWEDREKLNRGELEVDEKFRGPYRED